MCCRFVLLKVIKSLSLLRAERFFFMGWLTGFLEMFLRMFCFCFVVLLCFWRGVFLLGAGRLCYVFRARQRLAIPGLFACLFASLLLCLIFTPQWRILDIVIIDGWLHGAFFLMLRCWKDHPFPGQRNMTTLCNSWRLSRIYPSTSSHIDISVAMTVLLANYKNPEALKMNAWIFSRNICCKDPVNGSRLPEIRDIFYGNSWKMRNLHELGWKIL